jgi:hypothetical protein
MVANLIVPDLDRTQLREFPLSMEEDDYRVLARRYDAVRPGESYPLVVQSRDMGRKAITDLSTNEHYVWPFLPEFFVVDGYLINPDHSRIVVVVRIQDPESPGEWFLSTYGCALYTGFRRDAYQSPEFVPSAWTGGH